MKKEIVNRLKEIEAVNGIRILHAVETGSRAWGFPSPDSDYDVRFTYVEDLDWHLSLREKKDTMNPPIIDDLDITGWEIKKVLGLLWKSNVSLLERLQSPIIYLDNSLFSCGIEGLAKSCFSPVAVMHHYNSMAKKYYHGFMEKDSVRLKSYCYALRTAVAGKWVREVNEIPPIVFSNMFDVIEKGTLDEILGMISIKSGESESYTHKRFPRIDDFLKVTIEDNDKVATSLPSGNGDFDELDAFYREIVRS